MLNLALICHNHTFQSKNPNNHKIPGNPCKIREATSKVSRYACIIGHFATAATETIVEVGHSGAKQGETKQ